jgi:hypothetical protein
VIAVCLFLAGSLYVVGGRELMRRLQLMRSRATQALQPPTQAELQHAPADTTGSSKTAESDVPPVSIRLILTWSGAVLGVAVVAFFVTGHAGERRRD